MNFCFKKSHKVIVYWQETTRTLSVFFVFAFLFYFLDFSFFHSVSQQIQPY